MAEFRNPNLQGQGGDGGGSGGDMRGLMSVTLLALVVLLAFQYFSKPKQPATLAPAQSQSQAQNQQQSAQPAASAGQPATAQLAAGLAPAPAVVTPIIAASSVTETTVENDNLKIVFTNQGAQVTRWILKGKQYKDHPDPGGQQLDLVNPKTADAGLPLSLYTYEPELTKQLNWALYQVTVSGASASTGQLQAPGSVSFHYAANGLDVVKTFRFDQSYVITAEVEVKRNGVPVRALLAWPSGLGDQTEPMQFASGKFVWSLEGKDDSIDAKKVSSGATLDQPYDFAAITDLYFAAAFLPNAPARTSVVTLHSTIQLPSDPGDPNSQKKPVDVLGLAMGDTSGITRLRFFAGPKETDLLKTIHATGPDGKLTGPTLDPLIQFGSWLGVIAKPLYLTLRGLDRMLGPGINNWGWAIIIFTTIFTVIMLPLRFLAMKSSLKMMRIQPKAEAIKKRYAHLKATDPKRAEMNTETMALYKAEGVNMYGSCLPMLPQIPLFFAYFRVLQNAVELRQAHWLWLTDLSASDPKYILPILVILTMFLTQYITPSPGMDASQRRMMAIMMPLMMGFFLLHYASGLALYWGTSNLINLALQVAVNQSPMGKEMLAIAAKRTVKKSGGNPKTIQGKR
ncbi:MAG: membrane protein insertase YidC [Terracidiphilus sp.]